MYPEMLLNALSHQSNDFPIHNIWRSESILENSTIQLLQDSNPLRIT